VSKNWEVLAREIYFTLVDGKKLVAVFAPTGFGKTMSSPHLLALARKCGLARRLIHVVPTRALLRQIYKEKFVNSCRDLDIEVAYQSADRIPGANKSPYFFADLIVTTLESFLLNAYKLPPSELTKVLEGVSEGHYYPSFAAIASSIVVMDEAHIYLGDSDMENSEALVSSAVSALSRVGVPVVVESATMTTQLLESMTEKSKLRRNDVEVIYVCPSEGESRCYQVRKLKARGFNVRVVSAGATSSPNWITEAVKSLDEAVRLACELCENTLVLFISNSIDRAISVYKKLRNECQTALLHSLLSERDKEIALEQKITSMRKVRRGVIVTSPIAEAGVEIDADVLVTEPVPVENLVQRVGRLCRGGRKCDRALVYVIRDLSLRGFYNKELISHALERLLSGARVEWRHLWDSDGISYVRILEDAADVYSSRYTVGVYDVLERIVRSDSRPLSLIENLLDKFRGLSLVKTLIGWPRSFEDLNMCDYVLLNVASLKELEKGGCLERDEKSGTLRLVVVSLTKARRQPVVKECQSEALHNAIHKERVSIKFARALREELGNCLNEGEYLIDYFLVVKPECYQRGMGLRVG